MLLNVWCKVITICKLPQQRDIKMAHWSSKNETHDLPFSSHQQFLDIDYGLSLGEYCRSVTFPSLFLKRPVDPPTPRWNILRYLTTSIIMWSNKEFEVGVFDPLEYWHLPPEFWSKRTMLRYHSKANSSLSFQLCTSKKQIP